MDRPKNEDILKNLKTEPILGQSRRRHVKRMLMERSPRKALEYTPTGRRNWGKPLQKFADIPTFTSASSASTLIG